MVSWLGSSPHASSDKSIPEGQPFLLPLLQALVLHVDDPDKTIVPALIDKVPLGYFEPLPRSGIWPAQSPMDDSLDSFLLHCEGNWKYVSGHILRLQM